MTIATRLTSLGTLYVNGSFDEITTATIRTTTDTVYAATFDEVSFFGNSSFAQRVTNTGTHFVVREFDEFTGAPVVDESLVLWLDAAQTASYPGSGTTWTDLSGRGNTGTFTNGPTFSSINGGSIVFDGIDDYVNCGNSSILNVGNNITVNVWFYVNSNSGYQPILGKVVSDFSLGWELANSSGGFRTTFRPSANIIDITAGVLIVGNWYMGTMTFDNAIVKLYLNSVQTGSSTSGGPVTLNSTEPLSIGRRVQGNYYNGRVSHVSIYSRVLTDIEIQRNFNALRRRYGV